VGLLEEKLVRDKIPDIIRENGGNPRVRVAGPDELEVLLREKIVEEAKEFLFSGDTEELIELQRHSKLLARGGFTMGYVLSSDEAEGYE
jgi:predicted house-cleaning noncanonical NTP pyrophosphatase (MazG superfamily)